MAREELAGVMFVGEVRVGLVREFIACDRCGRGIPEGTGTRHRCNSFYCQACIAITCDGWED